jgi:carbon storage regulator
MALVLSRRCYESIEIGKDIIVTVADIQGDTVRLAIEAPITVQVDRKEIADAKRRERLADEARDARLAGERRVEAHEGSVPEPTIAAVRDIRPSRDTGV